MNTFIVAGVISFTYFIVRFMEMRFIDKDAKPLKVLVKDSLLVYFSAIIGFFIIDQVKPLITEGVKGAPSVFTDNPDF